MALDEHSEEVAASKMDNIYKAKVSLWSQLLMRMRSAYDSGKVTEE